MAGRNLVSAIRTNGARQWFCVYEQWERCWECGRRVGPSILIKATLNWHWIFQHGPRWKIRRNEGKVGDKRRASRGLCTACAATRQRSKEPSA